MELTTEGLQEAFYELGRKAREFAPPVGETRARQAFLRGFCWALTADPPQLDPVEFRGKQTLDD